MVLERAYKPQCADGSKISIDAVSSGGRNFLNDYTPADNKFIEIVKRVVEEYETNR